MTKHPSSKIQGFTLIEVIVSASIFVIVMLIAVGAVLSAVDANRKAQSLNAVINNLNLVFESMIRDMRTGRDYSQECTIQDTCLTFTDKSGVVTTYQYNPTNSTITKKAGSKDFGNITGDEVTIQNATFQLRGNGTGDGPQRVLLHIQGYAGVNKTKSTFNIETLITSRSLDVKEFNSTL